MCVELCEVCISCICKRRPIYTICVAGVWESCTCSHVSCYCSDQYTYTHVELVIGIMWVRLRVGVVIQGGTILRKVYNAIRVESERMLRIMQQSNAQFVLVEKYLQLLPQHLLQHVLIVPLEKYLTFLGHLISALELHRKNQNAFHAAEVHTATKLASLASIAR